jgi:flagellar biosynthesis/type III secretory pathway M-ring protein FliF/YscJ
VLDRPRTVAELESEIEAQLEAAASEKAAESRRLPVLTRHVKNLATKEPEQTAKLLRSWLTEQER